MINRIKDVETIKEALTLYPFREIELDVDLWVEEDANLAFVDEHGNVGLFEEDYPGVYTGHYFFLFRGSKAKDLAIRMLSKVYNQYGAKAIRGLTPVEHRAAALMTRILGFKDYGIVETEIGPCTVFVLTDEEFKDKHGTKK